MSIDRWMHKEVVVHIHIGILLSHTEKCIWVSSDEVDEPQYSSVQFSSSTQSCLTLRDPMNHSTPGLPVHHQLPEFTQTHVHQVGDAILPSLLLSSPSSPALNLSQDQGLFQWVSSSHQVPKFWSFSFNISPFNEHPGLISFRMDWLDFLAVQGTLKSLLQHTDQKHQFFAQPSLWSSFHIHK